MTMPVQDQLRYNASCTTPSVTTPSAVITPMPRNNHPIGVRGDLTATSQPTEAKAVKAIINESQAATCAATRSASVAIQPQT